MFKNSLFPSTNKKRSKLSQQNQSRDYQFRQANNSLTDPLLYTFDNADIELGNLDSDGDNDDNQTTSVVKHNLRTRRTRDNYKSAAHTGGSIVIVEKPILPNETLQAFAIRYRVSVSKLKRLNNLQNDQDFYALAHCRVPVCRFGLLNESSSTLVDLNDESSAIKLPVSHLTQQNHYAFLNAMDKDLALMRTKVEQLIETPSAVVSDQSISHSSKNHLIKPVITKTNDLNCDGADCGCRTWHIVLIILFIVLIPFIYAYYYIKFRHSHNL